MDKHKNCSTNCCKKHGCRYEDENCPVVLGLTANDSCDLCDKEMIVPWDENKKFVQECTREEWYKTSKFKTLRLINNIAHEIQKKTQHLNDLFQLLNDQYNHELGVLDKVNLVDRQIRVLQLEASNLNRTILNMDRSLTPNFTDMKFVK